MTEVETKKSLTLTLKSYIRCGNIWDERGT